MEEKNSNKEPKLRMINELSPDAQNYNYGDYDYGCGCGCGCGCGECGCGSCGCGCGCGCGSQGRGDGSDEANCMSEARYWELCMKNELTARVYVCGRGWMIPVVMVPGSSGIYTGWGTGASDCMSKDIFDRLCYLGLLKGRVYVCGQGWTWAEAGSGSCGCGCGSCGCGCGGSGDYPVDLMDSSKFEPWYIGADCLEQCKKVLNNYGISANETRRIHLANTTSGSVVNASRVNYEEGIKCINQHLNSNRVLIVAVDYNLEKYPDANPDGADHFVVITGRGYDSSRNQTYYTFMEVGTSNITKGCSPKNRLYYDSANLKLGGHSEMDKGFDNFVVTHIKANM